MARPGAVPALPDLCRGIASGRLETTQVSLAVLLCIDAPARPGLSFERELLYRALFRA
jgi:hypothetical protein